MTPFFNPGPIAHPKIPIYIAGVNTFMCQLAGELCDGLHIHPLHSLRYLHHGLLPEVQDGLVKSGRSRSELTLSTSAFVITGANDDEIERAKHPVRLQMRSTPRLAPILARAGDARLGRGGHPPERESREGRLGRHGGRDHGQRWPHAGFELGGKRLANVVATFPDSAFENPRGLDSRDGNLGGATVLGAVLRFRVDTRDAVKERVAEFLRAQGAAQPLTEHSCGCVFHGGGAIKDHLAGCD